MKMIVGFALLSLMSTLSQGIDLKNGHCIKMDKTMCFNERLDYNWTNFPTFTKSTNLTDARNKLKQWEELRAVPTCWQTIKPFLCYVYLPRCSNGTFFLPCRSLCYVVRDTACTMIPYFNGGNWPKVLDCDNYPATNCLQLITRNNETSKCPNPLKKTNYQKNWYNGIKGCGLECKNHLYSDSEHKQVHATIAVFGFISMFCNLFSVATFLIDWKAQSKYPARIIFFMNLCFLLSSLGWLLQFLGNTRDKITCREDGTRRTGEPGSESTGYGWCLFSFILIYYFSFAGILWFVMLSYAWHSSFRTLGSTKDKLTGKKTYFHVMSWMFPVIATISILVLEQVDGDSIVGICFVGIKDHAMRRGFVFIPFGLCLLIGEAFMIRGTVVLFKVKGQNLTFLNGRASTKIKETIIRIGFFSLLSCVFFITVLFGHVKESQNMEILQLSLTDFVRCKATKSFSKDTSKCSLKYKPNIALIHMQIISAFGAGITVSTWSWTKATLKTWKKAWIRFRGFDVRKRIQNSFNAMKNKRRVAPLVEHALPAVTVAVPLGAKAKRGSLASIASKQSSKLRISSFVSGIADEIRSKMKTLSGVNTKQNNIELRPSPILIRHSEGRRRSLLSVESILTTSSQGKLRLRRPSMQTSATSGSEFGMAFGHLWSVQPQLHVPTKNRKPETSKNLRVIRLGEDVSTVVQEDGKSTSTQNRKKRRKRRAASRTRTVINLEPDTNSLQSTTRTGSHFYLPPLKNELRQRSPGRWSESSSIDQVVQNQTSFHPDGNEAENDLKFFHNTFIGPK